MNGKIHDGEARERLIVWMRRRMAEYGITPQALADSIQHDLDHAPVYRDAFGNEWNGSGTMPNWLRAARDAGVSPDFFRIIQPPILNSQPTPDFGW
ncbi:H-NS family nucleoid-associated regulatory protein [Paraburkholderia heleia]|uniref:H-NS family nucleoid-associated regulatory protein n=1 Tax=Paraburkholderia heleia TaxID=634127 RepID=UPI0031E29390